MIAAAAPIASGSSKLPRKAPRRRLLTAFVLIVAAAALGPLIDLERWLVARWRLADAVDAAVSDASRAGTTDRGRLEARLIADLPPGALGFVHDLSDGSDGGPGLTVFAQHEVDTPFLGLFGRGRLAVGYRVDLD